MFAAGCERPERPPAHAVPTPCPAGVVARTTGGPLSFTAGWVRLTLRPCAGTPADAPAGRVEVEEADHRLAFSPGRSGGATAALLTGTDTPARGPQVFPLPAGSAQAREVALAPWPSSSPPPRLTAVQLLARRPAEPTR